MAATTHDIASRKLWGHEAFLNFPANLEYYQMPASSLLEDIRAAAVSAMATYMGSGGAGCSCSASGGGDPWPWQEVIDEFIGEEKMFYMPKMMVYMANAMQMPASSLSEDICAAAVSAMAAYMRVNSSGSGTEVVVCGPHGGNESSGSGGGVGGVESCGSGGGVGCSGSASGGGDPWPWQEVINEFIGEEEMFYTPKMMVYMANAMQVGPP
ncbi:hypothetical protein Vadar_011658 [Vaccinium darrowii]|uniref:Uncharacterized protein n=1 Tax=Vaccinium darrowii TaxID=229202 RepID=A0ACB7ZBY1_9ERIC|nr:hypothetical protein Vadar_011658 [Vaccinium darrowii]